MKYADYLYYFKDVAINLKDIAHTDSAPRFVRYNIQEILAGAKSKIDLRYKCMKLESYETSVSDALSDNLRDIKTGALMVLKHVKQGDLDDEDSVLAETELTILKVLSKMIKDKKNNMLVKTLDLSSIRINKVGPIFDNAFGWRMEFSFSESLNDKVVYDPADWNYY